MVYRIIGGRHKLGLETLTMNRCQNCRCLCLQIRQNVVYVVADKSRNTAVAHDDCLRPKLAVGKYYRLAQFLFTAVYDVVFVEVSAEPDKPFGGRITQLFECLVLPDISSGTDAAAYRRMHDDHGVPY